jgi:hypothetical protein
VLPLDETADHWTTVLSFITEKMTGSEPLTSVLDRYSTLLKQAACEHPKYSLLSQSETSALFKIECDGDKTESNLCYLVRGATRWHFRTMAIRQGTLSADITRQWSEIFRQSKIVIE